jgi:hypothetical protein
MSDAKHVPDRKADKATLDALERQIEAVPPRTTATIPVPAGCAVTTADVLRMGDTVKSIAFDQKDGVMTPTRLLVEGHDREDPPQS